MRLFVSVDLDGLEGEIEAVQELLDEAAGIRLTDPEQAHVTLKFLGDTDPDRLPELRETIGRAVEESGVEPFEADFGGVGVFPHLDYISVVWVGTRDGGTALTSLHEAIEHQAVELGFDPEDHEFTPHATIARMDHAGGKELVQDVVTERDPDVGRVHVDAVRLKKSELTADGPEYSTVEQFPL